MIKLRANEKQVLHMAHGSRQEIYKLELLDRYGVKKCDLELIDGTIDVDSNTPIQKAGTLKFKVPFANRKIENNLRDTNVVLVSRSGKKFELGIGIDGLIYTLEIEKDDVVSYTTNIQVEDNGILFTENIEVESKECDLIDKEGYTWEIGIELNGAIYSKRTDQVRKIYYMDEKITINYLSDRVKAYMGVRMKHDIKWWPLGVFLTVKPVVKSGIVTTQIYDECIVVQQNDVLEPKLFLKGTNYVDILKYLLISCGITKINIEATEHVLPIDLIVDDSKNKLDWFNYIAEQINYTRLRVNNNGWFISGKYREPSPLNVGYVYESNDLSVLVGEVETVIDYWQVPNVFKRVVAHPQLGEMVSIYENKDPTDPFSTINRHSIINKQKVDNVASQIELDNITRKAAFNAKQITQEISFKTVNMPHHESGDILDLRHEELRGIFVEQSYSIQLKAGSSMIHKAKRLVNLNEYN